MAADGPESGTHRASSWTGDAERAAINPVKLSVGQPIPSASTSTTATPTPTSTPTATPTATSG